MTASVLDPHEVLSDPAMPFVATALDHAYMRRRLELLLGATVELRSTRVTRWKPGRRCLIEYDVSCGNTARTLIGKIRARAVDDSTFILTKRLGESLRATGDGAAVPAARGAVPECHMWLQDKVDGEPAWSALNSGDGEAAARRIGAALACLHRALPPLSKRHTCADELATLSAALDRVRAEHPSWDHRVRAVQEACVRVAASVSHRPVSRIHRDFYHDQVLVDRHRVWILDLDLAAEGDPALDVGNFLAHIAEQSLRTSGDADACADQEAAVVAGFVQAGGEATPEAVAVWKTLSLARHIYISTLFEPRRSFTGALLTLCEQRLQL